MAQLGGRGGSNRADGRSCPKQDTSWVAGLDGAGPYLALKVSGKDHPEMGGVHEMQWYERLLRDDSGQDMVEYGLLCALISIVAIATLKSIGPMVAMLYLIKTKISVAI